MYIEATARIALDGLYVRQYSNVRVYTLADPEEDLENYFWQVYQNKSLGGLFPSVCIRN